MKTKIQIWHKLLINLTMQHRMILTPRTRDAPDSKIEVDSPRGLVCLFRFFVNKCHHDINELNFNRNTKFSNLSSEERAALTEKSQ